MTKQLAFLAFNSLGYYAVWFALIIFPKKGQDILAILITLAYIAIHFYFSSCKKEDARLLVIIVGIGLVLDGTFGYMGLFIFNDPLPFLGLPYWLLLIWIIFALLLNHSLQWLNKSPIIAILAGAIFAPLSYSAGQKLEVLTITNLNQTLGIIAFMWALLLPLLTKLTKKP